MLLQNAPASALVIVAHPDDAEFMCAGTIARWAAAGSHVTYCVITKGDKGSEDPEMTPARLTVIREAEQRAAGAILGVRDFVFMGYPDGYLQHTLELRKDLTRVIRQYRPEVVITFDPTARFMGDFYLNHPDHRTAGDAALDAIFPSARDRLTFPELLVDGLQPHKVRQVWLGMSDRVNVRVDIGATLSQKKQALLAHPSQIAEGDVGFIEQWSREASAGEGCEYAEAFFRIRMDEFPAEEG